MVEKSCRIVLVTGGFDPIHRGHIELLKAARKLGFVLIVGVNSEEWLVRKKGRQFMPIADRMSIVSHLRMVGHTITFNDDDGSACDAIDRALGMYPKSYTVVFANGGDRTRTNIPEITRYGSHDRVEFVFGVGGEIKLNSSSEIVSEAVQQARS